MTNPLLNTNWNPQQIGQRWNKMSLKARASSVGATVVIAGGIFLASTLLGTSAAQPSAPQPPAVAVSAPLQRDLETQLQALGQFSAVERVELRAQVGGTLTEIGFKDGDIVHKGDLLFVIDPTPYQIKLSQAIALRQSAKAKLELAQRQVKRATTLQQSGAGTVESADQRSAERLAAEAALDDADAQIRDAQFDLDHTRITAPFSGRIGSHQVSVGNLISGSRAGASPTTLLTTLVSLDPIYLDFDMSEADYAAFMHAHDQQSAPLADNVAISLTGESDFNHSGVLDFIDNSLDRSSGTIHARATVPNNDFHITPGGFGRVKVAISAPLASLMVPDAAVLQDQSTHMVYTVGDDNTVTPRTVETGDLRGGLRVIRSGLQPGDKVIIDSIPRIHPGLKITPEMKTITAGALDVIPPSNQKTADAQ